MAMNLRTCKHFRNALNNGNVNITLYSFPDREYREERSEELNTKLKNIDRRIKRKWLRGEKKSEKKKIKK